MDVSSDGDSVFKARARTVRQNRLAAEEDAGGGSRENKNEVKEDGQTHNGFYRRAGICDRCFKCDGKYHSAPKCPLGDAPRSESAP